MSIFDKLLAVKEIKFDDGLISLSGQRVLIIPQELAIGITEQMIKNRELVGELYEEMRKRLFVGWAEMIRRRYKFDEDPRAFVRWLVEVGAFVGWGKHELVEFNSERLEGVMRTYNAPIGTLYKEKVTEPIDHIWRGLTAGCASAAFQEDVDWLEIRCIATGAKYCDFLFKPRRSLTKEEKVKYKNQLPKQL